MDGTTGAPLNITHRDISPQNIMLSYDGEVRIIDFGIAKAESKIEATRAGTLKGKFGYMSPEQAEGYEVDFRTDIFSLGIVLWELLAQDRLFVSNNEINTLKKIRECHIPSLRKLDPNIPQELERITNKALARDRTLRYQSADELAQDLQVFLNKHYPEFTVRDLSQNLKDVFNDEREESRKKMIEYAKVQLPSLEEKTEYISSNTNTITTTDATGSRSFINAHQPSDEERNDGLPANFRQHDRNSDHTKSNFTSSKKLEIDIKNPGVENFNLQFDRADLVHATKHRPRPRYRPTDTDLSKYRSSYETKTNYSSVNPRIQQRKNARLTKYVAYCLTLIGVGYYFYLNPQRVDEVLAFANNFTTNTTSVASKQDPNAEDQKSPINPEIPYYNLLVTSVPSGAAIILNDKPTGAFTPGQIRVPVNTAYTVKLEKEGYLAEAKSNITVKQGDELRVTLKKKEAAYINVSVHGGSAAIYVNGKKIADNSPVLRYPVLANTPLKVQAYNPATKRYVEKFIELAPGTINQIDFNLDGRAPSNR